MKNFILVVTMAILLAGCSQRIMDFTIVSSKNVDLSQISDFERGHSRVEGVDKKQIIFFIPTGVPNAKEAIDRAIESVPGAVALVDGVVTHYFWWIPYIYGESYYVVEGTPIINPKLVSQIEESDYIVGKLNNIGELEQVLPVTEDVFNTIKDRAI